MICTPETDALAIVWFKRDLRLRDHAPLVAAASFNRAIGLFLLEPEWLRSAECDARHVTYLLASLRSLRADLAARGLPLLVLEGSACESLESLRVQASSVALLSHEETGTGWSYQRDRDVRRWCKAHAVAWHEWTQTGVVRRLKSRRGWASQWAQRMNQPQADSLTVRFSAAFERNGLSGLRTLAQTPIPTLSELGFQTPSAAWVEAFELNAG
jgi:deoxyribodipyrimidine photo-lyase